MKAATHSLAKSKSNEGFKQLSIFKTPRVAASSQPRDQNSYVYNGIGGSSKVLQSDLRDSASNSSLTSKPLTIVKKKKLSPFAFGIWTTCYYDAIKHSFKVLRNNPGSFYFFLLLNSINHLQMDRLALLVLVLLGTLVGFIARQISLLRETKVADEFAVHLKLHKSNGSQDKYEIKCGSKLTPMDDSWRLRAGRLIPFLWAFWFWLWLVWFFDLAIVVSESWVKVGLENFKRLNMKFLQLEVCPHKNLTLFEDTKSMLCQRT